MHGKQAVLSDLRVIGARAFVHIEAYTTKLGDKARGGKLCGFNLNSRAYRLYNQAKTIVVEGRNAPVLLTPPYSHIPTKRLDYLDDDGAA